MLKYLTIIQRSSNPTRGETEMRKQSPTIKTLSNVLLAILTLALLVFFVGLFIVQPLSTAFHIHNMPDTIISIYNLGKNVQQAKKITGATVYLDPNDLNKLIIESTQTWLIPQSPQIATSYPNSTYKAGYKAGNTIGIYLEIKNRPSLYSTAYSPPTGYSYRGEVDDIQMINNGVCQITLHKTRCGITEIVVANCFGFMMIITIIVIFTKIKRAF